MTEKELQDDAKRFRLTIEDYKDLINWAYTSKSSDPEIYTGYALSDEIIDNYYS